jgi:ABC-2 type transport system permease protein
MKKYLEIAKVYFKIQITYRFDVILNALGIIGKVLFAWILWGAIFSGQDKLGGMSFREMLSYYVIVSFFASLDLSEGISREISDRIRNGTFSKFMVIPAGNMRYFIIQNFGAAGYYGIFGLGIAIICIIIFRITIALAPNLLLVLCALAMEILGLIFMAAYQYFIGILTFKFQDIGFFLHIQGNIIAFITGAMIPLTLLPDGIVQILRFFPFYYVHYFPAMILTGQGSFREALAGLGIICFWTLAMLIIGHSTYERLRIKYDGVGI